MPLTQWLPARLRVGLLSLRQARTDLRAALTRGRTPPFQGVRACSSGSPECAADARARAAWSPPPQATEPRPSGAEVPASVARAVRHAVRFARSERTIAVTPRQTLLAAGRRAGVDLAFSCALGGCGTCRVRLLEGTVELAEPNCLTEDERAAGYVLLCVGRARGDLVLDA
ncbi:MAG: 2Fe-2S iron-sulfur cluster binding domain-containing protein [Deltaproteobacteria bacterium]|nr:2Fe-2S iron-sulfur cluster binding domain-containing protein [Deltaproteobacteria bacterium]